MEFRIDVDRAIAAVNKRHQTMLPLLALFGLSLGLVPVVMSTVASGAGGSALAFVVLVTIGTATVAAALGIWIGRRRLRSTMESYRLVVDSSGIVERRSRGGERRTSKSHLKTFERATNGTLTLRDGQGNPRVVVSRHLVNIAELTAGLRRDLGMHEVAAKSASKLGTALAWLTMPAFGINLVVRDRTLLVASAAVVILVAVPELVRVLRSPALSGRQKLLHALYSAAPAAIVIARSANVLG